MRPISKPPFWRLAAGLLLSAAALILNGSDRRYPAKSAPPGVAEIYRHLPVSFEPNQGQTDRRVGFLSRGSGYTLFLTPAEAVLSMSRHQRPAASPRSSASTGRAASSGRVDKPSVDVLRLELIGANRDARVAGIDPLPGRSNYFIGNDPAKWHANIPNFAKVGVTGVYPGIDLLYHGSEQGHLEYDFVVHPGADPGHIRMGFEGAAGLGRNRAGELVAEVGEEKLIERAPAIFQVVDGRRRAIVGGYVMHGAREAGFEVGSYDPTRPLIIDPALIYSTYLGGDGSDQALAIALDANQDAYVTGSTTSVNFPIVNSPFPAFEPTLPSGATEAFVTKLNQTGTALVYSTYLGGSGPDVGRGIAVDPAGDAFITGSTGSPAAAPPSVPPSFPTTTGALTPGTASEQAFVTELNPTGSALVYSTYLGGASASQGNGIAIDSALPNANAYVTGTITGISPTSAFVSALSFSGAAVALIYPTVSIADGEGAAIALEPGCTPVCDAYMTGTALLPGNPAPPFQVSVPAATEGALVAELGPGGAIVNSTYLAGSGISQGGGITLDSAGDVWVVGLTQSPNASGEQFPTFNPYQSQLNSLEPGNPQNAFVSELNPAFTALLYSTYFGGSVIDQATAVALMPGCTPQCNAYVTGATQSRDFPPAGVSFQSQLNGPSNAFVAEFNPNATSPLSLVYSTFLGGNDQDYGYGIAVGSTGNAYVAGSTSSTTFPTTSGVVQLSLKGAMNAFVSEISPSTPTETPTPSPTPTPTPTPLPTATPRFTTTLTVGAVSVAPNALFNVTAVLSPGICAPNQQIVFTFLTSPNQLQSATTNSSGQATVGFLAPNAGGEYEVQASFAGSPFCPSSTGSAEVTVTGPTPMPGPTPTPGPGSGSTSLTVLNITVGAGQAFSGTATVHSSTPGCLFPDTISFTFNGVTLTANTSLSGVAETPLGSTAFVASNVPGTYQLEASFAGRGTCSASSAIGFVTVPGIGPSATATPVVSPTPVGAPTPTPAVFSPTPTPIPTPIPVPTPTPTPVVVPSGTVAVTPPSLSFGQQAEQSSSATQYVTIANGLNVALNVSSITVSPDNAVPGTNGRADFDVSNCLGSVPAQSTCTINVSFAPQSTGFQVATLEVHDQLNSTPKVVLTGTGVVPVTASSSQLAFAKLKVGKTSAAKQVKIKNKLKTAVALTSISASGDFLIMSNTCGSGLAAKESCKIKLAFAPTVSGKLRGSLTIMDDANAIPVTIVLKGSAK
jgi:hypothetical protein